MKEENQQSSDASGVFQIPDPLRVYADPQVLLSQQARAITARDHAEDVTDLDAYVRRHDRIADAILSRQQE